MLLFNKIVEPSNECQGVFYTQKRANQKTLKTAVIVSVHLYLHVYLTQKTLKTAVIVSVHTGGVNTWQFIFPFHFQRL